MKGTALILGGYGNTGFLIAGLLMKESALDLIIAGRNLERAQAKADELNAERNATRASAMRVDASDPATLKEAFQQVDLVVVASSTIAYVENVARAALEARVDYFDAQLSSPRKLNPLRSLTPQIEAAGRCFITDGGFHPGLPAAMARYAARRFDALGSANIGGVIQMNWQAYRFSDATVPEMVEEFATYRPMVFKDSKWRESWKATRTFDFGPPFGKRTCAAMYLEEMKALPELIPSLKETGFFISGFNWFTDYVVTPIGFVALKAASQRAVGPVGRLLQWSLERFSRPPYRLVLVLEARGVKQGQNRRMRMSLSHADGYFFTAAAVVACLLQYLGGNRKPGLWFQAHIVEPGRFFDDMRRLGIQIDISEDAP
jgi:saccharopine dehydrogenase (NAD+, L-lysine-forming)